MDHLEEKLLFLKKVFGVVIQKGSGDPAVACPKCRTAHKKKLAIRMDDDRIHCWVCGLGGRLINLLVQYHPSHVHEYVTRFAGKNTTIMASADDVAREAILPSGFRLLAPELGSNDNEIRWAESYLRGRGLSDRDIWYFKFGVSKDPTMRRRVIMPSFDPEGILNFYTGRALDSDAFRKYMNCETDKKAIVFNEINVDWTRELTLVEGPFDLTKCDENATCLLGSSLAEDSRLFYQIYKHQTPVVLALDDDMKDKSWQRIARMLDSYGISVRILGLGSFKDVGEMTRLQFLEAKKSARAWDRTSALLLKIQGMHGPSVI